MEDSPAKPKRKMPKGIPFKKGQSGNPSGRPKEPLRKLTRLQFEAVAQLVIEGDVPELKRIINECKNENSGITVLQAMLASVAVKALNSGDEKKIQFFLDRLIGKVKEHVEHSGVIAGPQPAQVVITLPSNGREASGVVTGSGADESS